MGAPRGISRNWRFPSYLLNSTDFRTFLTHWHNFLDDNTTSDIDAALLWQTSKAVMRGHIISYISHIRKKQKAQYKLLHDDLLKAHAEFLQCPDATHRQTYLEAKQLLDAHTLAQAKWSSELTKNHFFRWGGKAGNLLARLTKPNSPLKTILRVRHPTTGQMTSDTRGIQEAFVRFYTDLYEDRPYDSQATWDLLSTTNPPRLSSDQKEILSSPITQQEVSGAISSLHNNKSPGPDGLSGEYYKLLRSDIVPLLTSLFNDIYQNGVHVKGFHEARLIVLPKPNKDPEEVGSYRPISLLNTDYKLLTKILSDRLQGFLPYLLTPTQLGFVQGRHSTKGVRTAIAAAVAAHQTKHPTQMLLSLDAEKAFDSISWQFLNTSLRHRNFGDPFLNFLQFIQSQTCTTLTVNRLNSSPIPIHRGTRQGCPLSPLLFDLALDPLLRHLHFWKGFQGIMVGSEEIRLSAFADDLLLFVSKPQLTLAPLLHEIEAKGKLLGYKLNVNKSEALVLTGPPIPLWSRNFPLRWQSQSLTYLGVQITRNPAKLYSTNLNHFMKSLNEALGAWSNFTLSFIGRANLLKMIMFPKLLYLFQTLPMYLRPRDEKLINKLFRTFIWQGKRPRIAYNILQQHKTHGGINFPDIKLYNLATNLCVLQDWISGSSKFSPLTLEAQIFPSTTLVNLLHSPYSGLPTGMKANPLFMAPWRTWQVTRKRLGLSDISYNLTFIIKIPDFTMANLLQYFKTGPIVDFPL